MKRESLVVGPIDPLVLIRKESKTQDAIYRAAFSQDNYDYLICLSGQFRKVGEKIQIRRVHYKICVNRCPLGLDGRFECESWQTWVERVHDGEEPIVRREPIRPGTAGWLLFNNE